MNFEDVSQDHGTRGPEFTEVSIVVSEGPSLQEEASTYLVYKIGKNHFFLITKQQPDLGGGTGKHVRNASPPISSTRNKLLNSVSILRMLFIAMWSEL